MKFVFNGNSHWKHIKSNEKYEQKKKERKGHDEIESGIISNINKNMLVKALGSFGNYGFVPLKCDDFSNCDRLRRHTIIFPYMCVCEKCWQDGRCCYFCMIKYTSVPYSTAKWLHSLVRSFVTVLMKCHFSLGQENEILFALVAVPRRNFSSRNKKKKKQQENRNEKCT